MTITYSKFFEPTVLGVTVATLVTVAGVPSTLLRGLRVRFTNTTTLPVTITAYAVPSSGTAANSNAFALGVVVGANGYLDIDVPILKVGDFLQALAGTAASITVQSIWGAYFA